LRVAAPGHVALDLVGRQPTIFKCSTRNPLNWTRAAPGHNAWSREESLHTPGRPTRSHADHRRILEAIQRRDEGVAHRSMLDHLIAVEMLVTSAQGLDRRDASAHRKKRSAQS